VWLTILALALIIEYCHVKVVFFWFAFGALGATIFAGFGLAWYYQIAGFVGISGLMLWVLRKPTLYMLEKNSSEDISSLLKTVGSNIVSALKNVEDACRNIKIEVHKHYGGGGEGYATGGFPTSGEYFFAREDGLPEMVGRVGRQTAVMNNGQIADTMAQSLIRAMGQGGGSSQPQVIENKLYLDGEVVYANQQKIQRSKGYNLGMGVFANV
jgi:hypothetical protein